jgi:hypothetical protein
MILTKYDEIMERITLSPEARDRIIDNVTDELSSDDGYVPVRVSKTRSKAWRKYITVAACCILVAAGAAAASRNGLFTDILGGSSGDGEEAEYSNEMVLESEEGTSEQKNAAASEEGQDAEAPEDTEVPAETGTAPIPEYGFSDEAELSDELGFSMSCPEIQRISEEAGLKDVSYGILNGNIGEIIYTDGESSNYFRKAAGTDDISGDYNVYDTELEFDGTDRSGTLKGKAGDYQLAVWTTADGYTYAAFIEEGLTENQWFEIIDSLEATVEEGE